MKRGPQTFGSCCKLSALMLVLYMSTSFLKKRIHFSLVIWVCHTRMLSCTDHRALFSIFEIKIIQFRNRYIMFSSPHSTDLSHDDFELTNFHETPRNDSYAHDHEPLWKKHISRTVILLLLHLALQNHSLILILLLLHLALPNHSLILRSGATYHYILMTRQNCFKINILSSFEQAIGRPLWIPFKKMSTLSSNFSLSCWPWDCTQYDFTLQVLRKYNSTKEKAAQR